MLVSLLALAAAAAPAAPVPKSTPIFVPTPRYPCFRQPAIVAAGSALLAFAENRNVSACAPEMLGGAAEARAAHPEEVGSLQLRRSTDGGESWTPMQSLHVGNIDFYSVVYDAKASTVWLMLQASGVAVLSSKNAGATWETSMLDAESVKGAPPGIGLSGPAVGHGIQISPSLCGSSPCAEAGRLVLPMVCNNATAKGSHSDRGCTTCNSCLLISDDAGKSWSIGAVGQQGTRESQIVQVRSQAKAAMIYGSERNMGATPGHRDYAISVNGGSSYVRTGTDKVLTEPKTAHWTGIVGSVVRLGDKILYSGPASKTLRAVMTIHTSTDGSSWDAGKVLWESYAGYSDMAPLPGGDAAMIIMENGNKSFSDFVSVAKITKAWLEGP